MLFCLVQDGMWSHVYLQRLGTHDRLNKSKLWRGHSMPMLIGYDTVLRRIQVPTRWPRRWWWRTATSRNRSWTMILSRKQVVTGAFHADVDRLRQRQIEPLTSHPELGRITSWEESKYLPDGLEGDDGGLPLRATGVERWSCLVYYIFSAWAHMTG
jgi:hypothetical protein